MRDGAGAPDLGQQFGTFGRNAGRDGAPLYRRISEQIAGDDEVLGLAYEAPPEQRRPNLLFAAVHYLLLRGADDPLGAFYPTVSEWRGSDPEPTTLPDPFPAFKDFCRRFRPTLRELLSTRATQTNEIGRCSALLPALATVAARQDAPLSLLDLGSSAGLNLLLDRYSYSYSPPFSRAAEPDWPTRTAGEAGSPVHLVAEIRSGSLPGDLRIRTVHRAGIDRDPVDPDDGDRSLWLLACQWPDHLERFRRLRAALALARSTPHRPQVAVGDVVDDLATAAAAAPPGSHLCVLHTWVAAYLAPARQAELATSIDALGRDRPVSWLFAENPYEVPGLPMPPAPGRKTVKGATAVVLVELGGADRAARHRSYRVADMHPHGRWLHWYGAHG